jgi:diguanylate cyclase (GGDEF)-like protein
MTIYFLILSALLLFTLIWIIVLVKKSRGHRHTARSAPAELYKIKTDISAKNKIFDLSKLIFGGYQKNLRKSPVLAAAEQVKKVFELSRFVVFCSERGLFLPLMGVGFKLKSIEPIKAETIGKILSGADKKLKAEYGTPLPVDCYGSLAKECKLPDRIEKPLLYYYKFNDQAILFVGEDHKGELAKYCTIPDYDNAVWPMLYDICRSNYSIKKHQEKNRGLQTDLDQAKTELGELTKKLRHKTIDLHSFYEVSNKMFTVYDWRRLIESYIESVRSILSPSRIIVLTRIGQNDNGYTVSGFAGKVPPSIKAMKLSADSEVFKILMSQKKALVLPVLSSGLSDTDPFVEKALAHGFFTIEKLFIGGELQGLALIGGKQGDKPYDESELEVFSTLTNMASLALDNIHQYMLIEKMSYTDYVTELYNYRYFYKRLNEEMYRAKRFDRMLALVIFDIDNFKVFNDTYGHQVGDEVLKNLSSLVTQSVRAIDIVSRYGGEEFCVIMPDTGFANCLIFIERLRKSIEEHKFTSKFVDDGYNITVSIGGAIYPVDAQASDRLIYTADMALLKGKSDGRNRSMMFNSLMLEDENLMKNTQQQLADMRIYEDL